LNEVLYDPPAVAAGSFRAPTPTYEKAVGLERFEHADVQAKVAIQKRGLKVGENFNLKVELVNAGKVPALLTKIEGAVPDGFESVAEPETYVLEDCDLNLKGRRLGPLAVEEVCMVLRPLKKGEFVASPRILYVDESGQQITFEPEPVTIEVTQVVLPGRIATGYQDLDDLLLGGIPQNYAVMLTSLSCDERDLLVKSFLEMGAKKGEVTFYVTLDPGAVEPLAEKCQSNFFLFICNPQADAIVKDLPNVFKLKGVENLTEIGISLTSAINKLDSSLKGLRRVCIDLVSDILLQHHAVQTRRCLSALIPRLRSEGFTILAVMDPEMHSPQEARAVLDLFNGEIGIYEKETEKGLERYLKIKRMSDQKYLKNELLLEKEDRQKRG
jgi:KaiC/GvpD/RAD55 family RecA-like ATPase